MPVAAKPPLTCGNLPKWAVITLSVVGTLAAVGYYLAVAIIFIIIFMAMMIAGFMSQPQYMMFVYFALVGIIIPFMTLAGSQMFIWSRRIVY